MHWSIVLESSEVEYCGKVSRTYNLKEEKWKGFCSALQAARVTGRGHLGQFFGTRLAGQARKYDMVAVDVQSG